MEEKIIAKQPENLGGPWDVVVIGSGPAGFSAAIYTTRGALSTLIMGGNVWGGQLMLTTVVDNFPGFPDGVQGPDLMVQMKSQAERFGAKFLPISATSLNVTKRPFEINAGGATYLAKTIIIATGAETIWLDVPGAKELIGRGVSSCAPCDAPFFKNKNVAVVGGGDSAMEEASVLTKYASAVTVIHRRGEFRASVAMQEKVIGNPKIKIIWNTEVTEIKGKEKLESLILKNNQTGESSEAPFDGLFIAIGHKPGSDIFKGVIEMDEKGYIKHKEGIHCGTSVDGIFVAGDVIDKRFKQAVVAAGMGCMAGMEAIKYLEETEAK